MIHAKKDEFLRDWLVQKVKEYSNSELFGNVFFDNVETRFRGERWMVFEAFSWQVRRRCELRQGFSFLGRVMKPSLYFLLL